jgi:predicted transglutaminase-like cysteine proteinase
VQAVVVGRFAAGLGVTAYLASAVIAAAQGHGPFMAVGGPTTQPIGHREFCGRHPSECAVQTSSDARVHLTDPLWRQLVSVNELVNRTIEPATDEETWGRVEWWEYPTRKGDCDDLMLLKRRDLIRDGWPVGALLMTVVRLSNGEGHSILTVLTDQGDFILDNMNDTVALWRATSYRFVKRQSQFDAGGWVSIADDHLQQTGSVPR